MMHEREKSDPAVVAVKPTNKAERSVAELVEPRARAEGNASRQSTHRAQNRACVSQALERKRRYTASQVVRAMREEGFRRFSQYDHKTLWKGLNAKDPAKGFGRTGDYPNTWVWYETWLAWVRIHCLQNAAHYV
jgi:hypothetical protein